MESYKAIGMRDWEMQRVVFAAAGAELPNPFSSQEESLTVDDIRKRASGDKYNDIVDMRDSEITFDYEG
jgi:hypothetical protein